jgi:hypothetical protein
VAAQQRNKAREAPAGLKDKLVALYRHQPGKVITLGGLLGVMLIVLAITVIRGAGRTATAQGGSALLPTSGSGQPVATAPLAATPTVAGARDVSAEWSRQFALVERLPTDPFRVEMTWFPLNPDRRQTTVRAMLPGDRRADPLTEHIRKWASEVTHRREVRASQVAAVQTEAAGLKLSTVMVSTPANSLAVINGEPLKVGQRISGFTVVRIEPKRVVVNKAGVPVVLELDH